MDVIGDNGGGSIVKYARLTFGLELSKSRDQEDRVSLEQTAKNPDETKEVIYGIACDRDQIGTWLRKKRFFVIFTTVFPP